jgi:hypothetical protein
MAADKESSGDATGNAAGNSSGNGMDLADGTARAVLPALIRTDAATTRADGAVVVGRRGSSAFLYGPYWTLDRGTWRLSFSCTIEEIGRPDDVFLGVEILLYNRFLLATVEFTARELANGTASLTFELGGSQAPDLDAGVEFRFLHFRAARFTITSVTLARESSAGHQDASACLPRWRLTPRLGGRGAGHATPSRLSLWPGLPGRTFIAQPQLTLPAGDYRLSFDLTRSWLALLGDPALTVEAKAGPTTLAKQRVASTGPEVKRLAFDFTVPADLSQDYGAQDPLELSFAPSGPGGLALENVELDKLAPASASQPVAAPAVGGTAPIRVLLVGNCQTEVMTNAARRSPEAGRVRATYHHPAMPQNLTALARNELATADILLVQDIEDFNRYPLKDEVPDRLQVHRFPILMFATPWPYDTMSGPPDRHAFERELVEQRFPNLDGALGRLRRQIPDPEERFRTYRDLAFDWPVDVSRLASFEERRLQAMDRKYGLTIGAEILENFRTRHDFHSVGHAGARLLGRLLDHLGSVAGFGALKVDRARLDTLRNVQVPVHPGIARRLGLQWADERTVYEFRGMPRTWETYVRDYIRHFG